jgi:hypothetical protein
VTFLLLVLEVIQLPSVGVGMQWIAPSAIGSVGTYKRFLARCGEGRTCPSDGVWIGCSSVDGRRSFDAFIIRNEAGKYARSCELRVVGSLITLEKNLQSLSDAHVVALILSKSGHLHGNSVTFLNENHLPR